MAVAVTLSGEVKPFGMAKLVTHKVKVALASCGGGKKSYHLMKRDTAEDNVRAAILSHRGIHLCIAKAEDDGLISNESLVVRLSVSNGLLVRTAVNMLPPDPAHIPHFIGLILDVLDPKIGKTHCKTEVEAASALLDLHAHTGHSGHILCDGNCVRINLSDKLIRELKVGYCLNVCVEGEVIRVGGERLSETVVVVKHRCNSVKAEAVKSIFGHPELQVRKKEVENLIFVIVEELGIPSRVMTLFAIVEVLIGCGIELEDTLVGVLDSVGVYHVEKNGDTHSVSGVNKALKLIRIAVTGGCSKEGGHLISKGTVIWVLHNRHNLNSVISLLLDTGEDLIAKFDVCTNLLFLLRHTDVALVYKNVLIGNKVIILPLILGKIDDLRAPSVAALILHYSLRINGNTFNKFSAALNDNLYVTAVIEVFVGR